MPLEGRRPIRAAIVNDYPVVVEGLARLFSRYPKRIELRELSVNERPTSEVDVILYDMFAQQEDVIVIPKSIRPKPPGVKLIFLGWTTDVAVIEHGMQHGVDGYIHKSLPGARIVESIQRIYRGERVMALGETAKHGADLPSVGDWPGKREGLTYRESSVVALITTGMSNQAIAKALFVSENTIKSIIKQAYRKMGVGRRGEAVAWGAAHGFSTHQKRYRVIYPDNTEGFVP